MLGFVFIVIGSAASAFLESVILSHFFKGETQPKSQGYVGIFTGSITGNSFDRYTTVQSMFNLGEMTASTNSGYSRQSVTWSTPADGFLYNNLNITFTASGNHTDNIDGIVIFDSITEATGNVLVNLFPDTNWGFPLSSPLLTGESYVISPGDLRIGHGQYFIGGYYGLALSVNQSNSQMTPYLYNKFMRRFLMNEDISVANGQYLGLMTVAPSWNSYFYSGEGITWNEGEEVSASDYSREPIVWSDITNISTSPQIENINKIRIIPKTNWGTLNAVGIWDAPTGGNLLTYMILFDSQKREMIPGREINIAEGTIKLSEIYY